MGKRLIQPAHNAEANVLVTMLHKGRNDGMKGTLSSRKRVRRRGIERKQSAAVLQRKSHPQHGYIRAEVVVVALNHGEYIAFAVGNGKVCSVAFAQRPRSYCAVCL